QEELDSMKDYPRFIEEARHDKSSSAILSMTAAMKADHSHYEYCQEASASEDMWKSERHQFYVCALCGFIHHWSRVTCPVCGARPELFLPFPDKEHFNPEALIFTSQEERAAMAVPDACGVWNFDHAYPTCLINAVEFTSEIADELHKRGWSDRDVYAIVLSLTEAAANSSEHGNKREEGKHVFVECSISSDFFFCTMRDEGEGFDPKKVPNPCLDENLLVAHGRGLKLISSYMSRVWFNQKGNKIFMLKNR
ncbi:MAG: ATP-binding protein, partial [Planctomycetia bacterium]|nr:ATP-binding protein [Planctomycetia bacterium]